MFRDGKIALEIAPHPSTGRRCRNAHSLRNGEVAHPRRPPTYMARSGKPASKIARWSGLTGPWSSPVRKTSEQKVLAGPDLVFRTGPGQAGLGAGRALAGALRLCGRALVSVDAGRSRGLRPDQDRSGRSRKPASKTCPQVRPDRDRFGPTGNGQAGPENQRAKLDHWSDLTGPSPESLNFRTDLTSPVRKNWSNLTGTVKPVRAH
ncbi:hypothetical protein TIFTF001_014091 [Ficus carica]|uniref:Uncharacterized protein n=1 Tax=Ficus carica TaxID=3494 RepID=A0AA88DID9_FICCA|nr:hypothetical protein TIFTF001_014091 [Ficus carica]